MGDRKFSVSAREKGSGLDKFNVAFFTASCDTADTNKRYAESLQLDYPILSDPKKDTARAYGVVNDERPVPFRWTYIIGTDGKVLYVDKEVSAKTHGTDLVKKLKELGVKQKYCFTADPQFPRHPFGNICQRDVFLNSCQSVLPFA